MLNRKADNFKYENYRLYFIFEAEAAYAYRQSSYKLAPLIYDPLKSFFYFHSLVL